MPFRFCRSIRIAPGVRLNVVRRGLFRFRCRIRLAPGIRWNIGRWGLLRFRRSSICIAPALVALCLAALPAGAADPPMPSYDVAAACRGDHDEKACVAAQYAARSLVSDAWLSVTPAARAECVATDRWNDYGLLWACVESHQNDSKVLQ